jgi:hypothetical protein
MDGVKYTIPQSKVSAKIMDWDENKVRPFEYVIAVAKAEAEKQRFVQSEQGSRNKEFAIHYDRRLEQQ